MRGAGAVVVLATLLLAAPVLLVAAPALAADPEPSGSAAANPSGLSEAEIDRRASAIAARTMSPFCPGRTLSSCPSPNAAAWREDIRRMVAEGKSAEEIHAEMEKRAGSDLSGAPRGAMSWALPVGITLASVLLLGLVARRLLRGRDEDDKPDAKKKKKKRIEDEAGAPDAALDARLDAELEHLDG